MTEQELLVNSHFDQTERLSRCTTVTFPGCLHILRRQLPYVEYRTHNSIQTNATKFSQPYWTNCCEKLYA